MMPGRVTAEAREALKYAGRTVVIVYRFEARVRLRRRRAELRRNEKKKLYVT